MGEAGLESIAATACPVDSLQEIAAEDGANSGALRNLKTLDLQSLPDISNSTPPDILKVLSAWLEQLPDADRAILAHALAVPPLPHHEV
jgi:hypothetical protein